MVFQKKRIAILLLFSAFWFYLFYVLGTVELSLTVAVLEIGMGIAGAAFIFTLLRCVATPLFFGSDMRWLVSGLVVWVVSVFLLSGAVESPAKAFGVILECWLYLLYIRPGCDFHHNYHRY